MRVQPPVTSKANTGKAGTDVKESDLFSGTGHLEDGGLRSQSPSSHLSGGRGFHKEGDGNRRGQGWGLKSPPGADEHGPFR